MAFTLILLVCSLFISPTYGIRSNSATGFIAKMIHSSRFYKPNMTDYNWAKVAVEQSKERISYHAQKGLPKGIFIPTTTSPSAYFMIITIGNPEKEFYLLADTASSLTWIHCVTSKRPEGNNTYNPRRSSSYRSLPCSSQCLATYEFDCEVGGNCKFDFSYGDGRTQTVGEVGREMFRFSSDIYSHDHSWVQLIFGCGLSSIGDTNEITGIVGLDRHKMSLVSQLSVKKFSYCFSPNTTMYIRFGSYARITGRTTPMLQVPGFDYYYLYPKGISVGSTRLLLRRDIFNVSKDGGGGFIIDSGATVTSIEPSAFLALTKALEQQSKLPMFKDDRNIMCFGGTMIDAEAMPYITFHFSGGVDLTISAHGAFEEIDPYTFCLLFEETPYGGINILGNNAQLDHNIGYDLEKGVLSIQPRYCNVD